MSSLLSSVTVPMFSMASTTIQTSSAVFSRARLDTTDRSSSGSSP